MMRSGRVLLLDDGELDSVRDALEDLDAQVVQRRDRTVRPERAVLYDLLVTTVPRALAGDDPFRGTSRIYRPTWIALHNQDFLPLRARLRRSCVDYLVQNMVDPEVIRLLLQGALFSGTERRAARRLPVGSTVAFESEEGPGFALLAEIAPRGCRLLASDRLETGDRVSLELPPALSGGRIQRLAGHVVRSAPESTPEPKQGTFAVAFDAPASCGPDVIAALEAGRCIGTRVTCLGSPESDLTSEEAAAPERREARRAGFGGRVTALRGQMARALQARDLSVTGMRVAGIDDLDVGDAVEIAIQAAPREEPIFVRATAVRCGEGVALRFHPVGADTRYRLERLVGGRPAPALGATPEG